MVDPDRLLISRKRPVPYPLEPTPAASFLFFARLRSSAFRRSKHGWQIQRLVPILRNSPVVQWLPVLQNLFFTSPAIPVLS